jgi:hypothetical protein
MSVITAILVHKSFNSAGHSIIAGKAIMLLQKLLFLHKKCGDARSSFKLQFVIAIVNR